MLRTPRKDKIYLAIFIVVAVIIGLFSYRALQRGIKEIEANSAEIQSVEVLK